MKLLHQYVFAPSIDQCMVEDPHYSACTTLFRGWKKQDPERQSERVCIVRVIQERLTLTLTLIVSRNELVLGFH